VRWWEGAEGSEGEEEGEGEGEGAARYGEVSGGSGGRRVLVAVRGRGSERGSEVSDVQNWREVVPVLQTELQQMHGRDFRQVRGSGVRLSGEVRAVEPATMRLEEQAVAFASAGAILGAHGSNLANMIWLPSRAAVVEVGREGLGQLGLGLVGVGNV
jgi:hypothetical protein